MLSGRENHLRRKPKKAQKRVLPLRRRPLRENPNPGRKRLPQRNKEGAKNCNRRQGLFEKTHTCRFTCSTKDSKKLRQSSIHFFLYLFLPGTPPGKDGKKGDVFFYPLNMRLIPFFQRLLSRKEVPFSFSCSTFQEKTRSGCRLSPG